MSIRNELMRIGNKLYYDYQDIRIKAFNRMRDIVRKVNEGIEFDEVEEKKEKKDFSKKYPDGKLEEIMANLVKENKITKDEYEYYENSMELIKGPTLNKIFKCKHCKKGNKQEIMIGGVKDMEMETLKIVKRLVKSEPIWTQFLSKIRGIGELIATSLIKSFGYCKKFPTISRLWAYTGNHVVNGKAPVRERGKKLGYNNALKTMTWKISDSLMKSNKGYYRSLYEKEKKRQAEREYPKGELAAAYNGYEVEDTRLLKGHCHNRALRKIRKVFLSHYWEACREIIGLPTERIYIDGVGNHSHVIHWKEAIEMEE